MKISLIVAMSSNRVIGNDNALPWHIPEDLKWFKANTLGHPVIMGRKTFDSIGKALPKRTNIVLSRDARSKISGVQFTDSLDQALRIAEDSLSDASSPEAEVFIIGGAEIYALAWSRADRIYLTLIDAKVSGDAFFPEVSWDRFKEVFRSERKEPLPFAFLIYERAQDIDIARGGT